MNSPFPGMDPYLEDPAIWPSMHHGLISESVAELNRQLRPKYYANLEERVYVSDEDDPGHNILIPDVHIVRLRSHPPRKDLQDGGTAVIEPIEISSNFDEVHDVRIEIVDRLDRSIVTVIEILSPTNKLKGSYGRQSYQTKRRQVLSSPSHLVEIDLLRGGARMHIREKTPPYDYLVHVSRANEEQVRSAKVWPIPISLRLPVIPIPLKKGDEDARLDLQVLLDTAYEHGAFDLKLDYSGEPVPPLTPEQSAWAKGIIAARVQSHD